MDRFGKVQELVQWAEGLLLYPQHFQQDRNVFDQRMHYHMQTLSPFHWGVHSLHFDKAVFAAGRLDLTFLSAIFPDGTVVHGNMDNVSLDMLAQKEYFAEKERTISLAVVKNHSNNANQSHEFPRYRSLDGIDVEDENTGDNPVRIPRLGQIVSLLADDIVPERYSCFPLMRVKFSDDSFVVKDFIPPSLGIYEDSVLYAMVKELVAVIRSRIAFLSERLHGSYAKEGAYIFSQYEKIYQILCSRIVVLESLLGVQGIHPFKMYQELCILAGTCCGLQMGQMPPIFKPYTHNDLKSTFVPLVSFIQKMLESVRNPCFSAHFDHTGGVFELLCQEEWLASDKLYLGISLRSDITIKAVNDWLKGAIIASQSLESKVKQKRILGVGRRIVDQVPDLGLVTSRDKLLVEIDNNPEYIKPDELLRIVNPSDSERERPLNISLYVVAK